MKPPSGRLFGFALATPFALIALTRLLRSGEFRWWAVGVSAALVLVAVARPSLLDPLATAWTRVMRPVHQAITILAMGLLFYLVVTPVGALRRLFVRDPMRLRIDPQALSYWRERRPPGPEPESMVYQF